MEDCDGDPIETTVSLHEDVVFNNIIFLTELMKGQVDGIACDSQMKP